MGKEPFANHEPLLPEPTCLRKYRGGTKLLPQRNDHGFGAVSDLRFQSEMRK